jgi:hypothetical protein|tara:strand:+ start:738 stop:1001 length:264 start_codon:yes stop_codon:yes gene_type:complete
VSNFYVELTDEHFKEMFKKFQEDNLNTLTIELEKSEKEEGYTFSETAMENLLRSIKTFISAKMMKVWNDTDNPPIKMSISLEVKIES